MIDTRVALNQNSHNEPFPISAVDHAGVSYIMSQFFRVFTGCGGWESFVVGLSDMPGVAFQKAMG